MQLGSEISGAAGIPTGWTAVLKLIEQIARNKNESLLPTADHWYRKYFGAEPDYSDIIANLPISPKEPLICIFNTVIGSSIEDLYPPFFAAGTILMHPEPTFKQQIGNNIRPCHYPSPLLSRPVRPFSLVHKEKVAAIISPRSNHTKISTPIQQLLFFKIKLEYFAGHC